jgi:coproporphyrinogen III oxidase
MMINKDHISAEFQNLQKAITLTLEKVDGKGKFVEDRWERPEGGGGISKVLEHGALIEKGGVNFSAVFGKTPDMIKQSAAPDSTDFFATGVSIVLHPQNPFVPIIHMNIRYFETNDGKWWFGGGMDLTPHYIDMEDASFFHKSLKNVCDKYDVKLYPEFKTWADDYFYISHRKETRGIGGIFFDRLYASEGKETLFNLTLDVGKAFLPIYHEISMKHKNKSFSQLERDWQLIRRGRYAEFNLSIDRGTKFGLESNGRIESILMSLPPMASWKYNHIPSEKIAEYATLQQLKKNIDWINL